MAASLKEHKSYFLLLDMYVKFCSLTEIDNENHVNLVQNNEEPYIITIFMTYIILDHSSVKIN